MTASTVDVSGVLAVLNARVFERGWLSANNILFCDAPGRFTLVDTGAAVHAPQTLNLVRLAVAATSGRLDRIVNTHLHSDHCGGNAALQDEWRCQIFIPAASEQDVQSWADNRLSYSYTGQDCDRFQLQGGIAPGSIVQFGGKAWLSVAAPGHDHKALMFFEPETATLLAGDALWEQRLAVVFPELAMEAGFDATAATLDAIEHLAPKLVIPGHGSPFTDVAAALDASRKRLAHFAQSPAAHAQYAARSLFMFYMLQKRQVDEYVLRAHLQDTPVFSDICITLGVSTNVLADQIIDRLLGDGLLERCGSVIACK